MHIRDFTIHLFLIGFICRKYYFIKRKFNFSYRIPNFISRKMIYISRKPTCIMKKLICIGRKINLTSRKHIFKKIDKGFMRRKSNFRFEKSKIHSCEFIRLICEKSTKKWYSHCSPSKLVDFQTVFCLISVRFSINFSYH